VKIYSSEISGSLKVRGDIFAENYVVKSTVSTITQSFSSGSTIFGDSNDDTHRFTGSLFISASRISFDDGKQNIAVGKSALYGLTTGTKNTAVGYHAGAAITTGIGTTFIGYNAGYQSGGGYSVIIGDRAFDASTDSTSASNVIIGANAGGAVNSAYSSDNVFIGYDAGLGGSGRIHSSIAIGRNAMKSTAANAVTGQIAIGHEALSALTSGDTNLAIGYEALKTTTTGKKYCNRL